MRKNYKIKVDKKKFFYPRDFQRVLDMCNNNQKFTMKVLINTGARINEAKHIEMQDLDKDRENIILRITKVRAKLKETRPTPRIIPVSTQFFRYLKRNINTYKILSTNQTGLILKKYAKQLNITNYNDYSAQNIRKTFGTWMLALGIDGFKLAQYLGHSPEMLRTSYASPDIFNSEDKDRMREVLGNLPQRLRN